MDALLLILTGATALAGAALVRAWVRERSGGVVVLMYHRLRTEAEYAALSGAERRFSVPVGRFRAQLAHLAKRGARFIDLETLRRVVYDGAEAPPGSVLITFDDGAESVHSMALPVLRELGAPGVVFVTVAPDAWVFAEQRRLTDDELRLLDAGGVRVGAHGATHAGLRRLDAAAIARELVAPREALEQVVGRPVDAMAIPLNIYDARALAACRRAGYGLVLTANPGRVLPGDDPMRIRRFGVEGWMAPADLERSLRPGAAVQRRLVNALKRLPPAVLGEDRWMPLRARIFGSFLGRWLTLRVLRPAIILCAACWGLGLAVLWWLRCAE